MFGNGFTNHTLKRYVEAFGFLFKNIHIERTNGVDTQRQIVPIEFGPAEKYIKRNQQDPKIERPISVQYPRMSYNLVNIARDTSRQLHPLQKIRCIKEDGTHIWYMPVPYQFFFELSIRARHIHDMYKITDQIIPYFSPFFAFRATIVDGACAQNLIITLDSVDMRDTYEGPIDENRVLEWTIRFVLDGWFYGPDIGDGDEPATVIRWVRTNVYGGVNSNAVHISANTYPTVEGKTLEEITPEDDYVIVTDIISDTTTEIP